MGFRVFVFAASCWLAAQVAVAQPVEQQAAPAITPLRGDLYRAGDGARSTVFLVTPEGILLADPLGVEFARWFKGELDRRFPGRPVKYVVYTALDFERTGGASVFDATAEIVASAELTQQLSQARSGLPPRLAALDRNASGVLESSEVAAASTPAALRGRDRDGDGRITANEAWSDVVSPERTYGEHHEISLGGRSVSVIPVGPLFGPGAVAVNVPSERTIFSHDHPALTSPFANAPVRPRDVVAWTEAVASADFDTLVAGNSDVVSRADLDRLAGYVRAVMASVASGYDKGESVGQMQQSAHLAPFDVTPFAASRAADVARVYDQTRLTALDVLAATSVSHVSIAEAPFCGGEPGCDLGRPTGAGGTVGIGLSIQRFRLDAEWSWRPYVTASKTDSRGDV